MPYDPEQHHRRSIRLKGYDYTVAAAYYVTLCTLDKCCRFGDVIEGEMRLNALGRLAESEWLQSAVLRENVELDAFVVMPNHVHGVVVLTNGELNAPTRATQRVAPTKRADVERARGPVAGSLGAIVAQYKAAVIKQARALGIVEPSVPTIWQRGYYEHVVRNDADLDRIREYIAGNPMRWMEDELNPEVLRAGDPAGRPYIP